MGDTAINMIGFRSGRLKVLAPAKGPQKKRAYWFCRCDCSKHAIVMGKYLRAGEVKSCGCLNRQSPDRKTYVKHGHTAKGRISPTYHSWAAMIGRCRHPVKRSKGYKGVLVCEEWKDFRNFLADMGRRPKGTTLDRYPNRSGNYEPGNVRWATAKEQATNRDNKTLVSNLRKRLWR